MEDLTIGTSKTDIEKVINSIMKEAKNTVKWFENLFIWRLKLQSMERKAKC